jgi:NAD(P)-dependent dehydrogenase (short-subunit alcohol dehydrogenase family)
MDDAAFERLPADWEVQAGSLRDRVILITGATGGLGRATALAAAGAGATAVLLGRNVRRLETVYDELTARGGAEPAIYPLDLAGATPQDYGELAERIARECGRLDGIVHAAAHFDGLQPALDLAAEEWLRLLHINLAAPFLLTQACAPLLREAADAAVVFVLDDLTRMRRAHWGGYGVAKHGLAALAGILAEEWEHSSVRVHTLLPAPMRTTLRRAAYYGENTLALPPPTATAALIVYLLAATGRAWHGRVLDLRQTAPFAILEDRSCGS